MTSSATQLGFDRRSAITRSMLGWGVVVGPFYLIFGLILALTRPGFDLTRHALSMLLLGDLGWLQALNLTLSGVMAVVAAIGLLRTPGWPRVPGVLVGVYGACLVLSAAFPPDPNDHFPPGAAGGAMTLSGLLHLAFGAVGFLAIGVAALSAAAWLGAQRPAAAPWSRIVGVAIIVAFLAGAALSMSAAGVALLWLAVLLTWAWLAGASLAAYRAVPHPDGAPR